MIRARQRTRRHRPLRDVVTWLAAPQRLLSSALAVVAVASAIGVIQAAHETRQQYASLQQLEKEADDLDSEYERLLLEESAWADFSRIDQLARQELFMDSPDVERWVVLGGDGGEP